MITYTEISIDCEILQEPTYSGGLSPSVVFQYTPTKNGIYLIQFFATIRNDEPATIGSTIEYRCGSTITPYNSRMYVKELVSNEHTAIYTANKVQINDYTTEKYLVIISGGTELVTIFNPRLTTIKVS